MSDLRDLYQEVILDHSRRPRNFRVLDGANHRAEGFNPLCGDRVTVFLRVEEDVVKEVTFQGSGCAISTASASMLTETLKGKTRAEVEALFEKFHALVTGGTGAPGGPPSPCGNRMSPGGESVDLGKLAAFSGVREFPVRVKCATLAWHTLTAAFKDENRVVSTE